jgi:[acyl-carrier-protein] S-malonyltransferase
MANAFIFPGQGAQEVGMGHALAEAFPVARAVFDEVDDALGEKLSDLLRDGPGDQLTLTQNAQPALMAVSMAVVRVFEAEFGITVKEHAQFVAGHSLGEYSALAAAGTFSIADAARLLRIRGLAMQEAVPVGQGAMAALLGVGLDVARTVAEAVVQDGEVCQVANDNEPAQVVLSGSKAAIDRIQERGKEFGVRRAVPLPVSAPFHCALMQPAADVMQKALGEVTMNAPVVPVIANITAGPLSDPEQIKNCLVEQVTGTVRWRECMLAMTGAGVTNFYELGAGKVLSGLVRRIEKSASAAPVGTPEAVETAADAIKI